MMMVIRFLLWVGPILATVTAAQAQPLSTWMLDSIIARQDGITSTGAMTRQIEKGIFQEALRAAINHSDNAAQRARWTEYHHRSVEQAIQEALNASKDAMDYGLDRLCLARSLLELPLHGQYDHQALQALRESVRLQPRNSLGGLWYYANPPAPYNYYGDASYADGMYGYAPYAALWGSVTGDKSLNLDTALMQLELIYHNARDPATGLVKHGYELSRNASWADAATGASPIIWGRSLGWYTVGLVDALERAATRTPAVVTTATYHRTQTLLHDLISAEMDAVDKSVNETGCYGIWQVVDRPGAPGNFIESSAGALITFAMAKSSRLGYLGDMHGRVSALVRRMHQDLVERFVGHSQNGTLDYFGTSAMASLHKPRVDYEYYVNLSVTTNSLIGTSAFVLASLEVERMG